MKCPTCKEIQLIMTERQGIEIDYCPDCRGVWLGEHEKVWGSHRIGRLLGLE